MRDADLVVLAIPGQFLQDFLKKHEDLLCDGSKILVDISNYRAGEDLGDALNDALKSVVPWVKAFNDSGAVALMGQTPDTKAKVVTEICGKNTHAVEVVKNFGQDALGFSVKIVPFDRYLDIKGKQQTIGKEWIVSIIILLVIFALTEIYAMLRYNYFKGYDWYHLLLQTTNKVSMVWED